MDAERLLQRMCERRGLEPDRARELLPLVQRALVSPDDVRNRILTLIESTLARRADGDPTATLGALERELDDEVLRAVARTVHGWDPPWRRDGADDGPLGGGLPDGLGGGL